MTLPSPQPNVITETGTPPPSRPDVSEAQRAALEKRLQRARAAARSGSGTRPPIAPRAHGDSIPLSHAQERLWFLDQLLPDRGLYNIYQAMRIHGPLDAAALDRALNELVQRHDVFRTTFIGRDEGPVQVVAPTGTLAAMTVDLSALPAEDRERQLLVALRAEAMKPFDLTRDLLLRALLVRLGEHEHVLLLTMHHIVSDGWSLGILFRELGILHDAFSSGRASPLPGLPIRFADYATWERESLQGDALEKPLAYWRKQLAGAAPLELLTDHPRSPEPNARGASYLQSLPAELVRELRQLSQREGTTLFMTLLAGFQALLNRHTGQDDIVVGSCVAGRPQVELENLAGFFVNTIVFRTDAGGRPAFRDLLRRTRETVLGAMAHQDLPFDKIVAELQPDRGPTRNPFFQVMFVLQSAAGAQPQSMHLKFEPLEFDNGTAKFDLTVSLADAPHGGLAVAVEYRSDLYDEATIARLLGHYQTLLTAAVADPARSVAELPVLTAPERRQLLQEWNGGTAPYPRDATIVDAFREHVLSEPDAIATFGPATRLTYRELDERSNRLARYLVRQGAGPGKAVAFCCDRSPLAIMTLLGILKSGAAYVALEPAYPAARLALMLEDCRPAVLLFQQHLRPLVDSALGLAGAETPRPALVGYETDAAEIDCEQSTLPPVALTAESTAYICYTSGSTGRPKGVCVPHRGVVRLVRGQDYVRFGPGETFLHFAPIAFDASTMEIWGALLNGSRLAVFPPGLPSLAELADFIRLQGVTSAVLTTGLCHQLLDERADQLGNLRQLVAGGEVLSPVHAAKGLARLPGLRLVNGYGPTENTTMTTGQIVTAPVDPLRAIPIGRPIANTTVYVLDPLGQLVPVGVPGELCTGGDGLASGYLNRPDLNAERFIANPFDSTPGSRLYRTGDLARWRADGTLEFLGRADRQVKLRGFRIELGEIESVLTQHPGVGQAAVLLEPSPTGPRLIAYIAGRNAVAPEVEDVRAYAKKTLPEYMVPAAFVPLREIPLNANGKVDRAALPASNLAAAPGRPPFVAPRDDIETLLVGIWEKTLGVTPIGVHDSFFQLGGHSMAGVRMFSRIEREFGRRLPLASLFEHPTIETLANRLREPDSATTCSSLVALQPRGSRPPVFFFHGAGGGNLWTYTNLVPHLGDDQPVYALESRGMRGLPEFERIEDMAAHYLQEMKTVQPRGPYYLAGYCFGGNVAYEIARQLEAKGETVAMVALLDSAAANSEYQKLPWWNPKFHYRFAGNTAYWLSDFFAQPWREQGRFFVRKTKMFARRAAALLRGRTQAVNVEEVIDISLFPEIELGLWKTHLQALNRYQARPFGGRVVLFRTRGHPFLCSFDPLLGWGPLVAGVDVVPLTGAHEGIFMEPHVRSLSGLFRTELEKAQQNQLTDRSSR